jgi:peptidyl-prolyl cis-trans isomerase C
LNSENPGRLQRLAREPLVHFLILGAVLFSAISVVKDLRRPRVTIEAQELEQLATYWEMQMQRPPTRAELAAIIHERVDEELLAREAVRLGLDKDDMIIRRRLAQKMAFASEDSAAVEPDVATLRTYYAKTRDSYATPARLALRHLFFSRERTDVSPQVAAAAALREIKSGGGVTGDPSLLPLAYADVSLTDLARDYGGEFVQAARSAPLMTWVGPVNSPFGVHLLRIEARMAPQVPSFESVHDEVRAAWLLEQRKAGARAYLGRLRKAYRVEVAGLPE